MRTINAFRNFITGFAGQLVSMLLSFASRTVFIYVLGEEYLGVNGLFSSILSVLSFSELGIGAAITYELYKPIADKDSEKIRSLMLFYKKAYFFIGSFILLAGLVLLPFLPYLMKETTGLVNVRVIYVLFLVNNAASYWLFSYKQNLLYCMQKNYVNALVTAGTSIAATVLQIVLLLALRKDPVTAFYAYTVSGLLLGIASNYALKYQADKMYPELCETGAAPLDRETKKHIFKNVTGLTVSNLCGIALTSADNILISAFISVGTVGVYGNYLTLKKYISRLMDTLFGSIAAGIGDVCAGDDMEKKEHLFRVLQFTYFWLYGFTAICFWHLYNVFIAGVWLHDTKWLLPDAAVALIVINYLLDGLNGAVYKYRVACGLHWEVKYRHLFSAIFNVFISYALMGPCGLGVTGVLLGTTASILIMISFDPYLIYKKVFKKSSIPYYLSYIGYLALIAATCALVSLLCAPFSEYNVLHCLIRLAICLIVPNGVWFILFRKSPPFLFLWDKMYKLLGSVKRKVSDGRKDNEQ